MEANRGFLFVREKDSFVENEKEGKIEGMKILNTEPEPLDKVPGFSGDAKEHSERVADARVAVGYLLRLKQSQCSILQKDGVSCSNTVRNEVKTKQNTFSDENGVLYDTSKVLGVGYEIEQGEVFTCSSEILSTRDLVRVKSSLVSPVAVKPKVIHQGSRQLSWEKDKVVPSSVSTAESCGVFVIAIPGVLNPADVEARLISDEKLKENGICWQDPEILHEEISEWPKTRVITQKASKNWKNNYPQREFLPNCTEFV